MRQNLVASLLAVLAGAAIGLLYAWVVSPLRYKDTTPATLRADFKDAFRVGIASSYAATHNLERASARLALLGDPDPIEALSAQAQRMLASGESFQVVQDVASLASDLQAGVASIHRAETQTPLSASSTSPAAFQTAIATPLVASTAEDTSEPTFTETPESAAALDTPTPRPTRTVIPTAGAPFELVSRDDVCNPNLTSGLLQISILDRRRHQMPGVEINISWNGGEESFFTGLKPEIADGYADFIMQAGVNYAVRVARSSTPVTDLSAPACPEASSQTYMGGLKLVFQQP